MVSTSAILSTLALASGLVAAMPKDLPAGYGSPSTICTTTYSTSRWTNNVNHFSTGYSTCFGTTTISTPWSTVTESCNVKSKKRTWSTTSCKVESYPVTSVSWVTKTATIDIPMSTWDTYTETTTKTLSGISSRVTVIPTVSTHISTSVECQSSSTVIAGTSCHVTTPAPVLPTGYGY